ncbi:MAG: hypothetical protein IT371_03560 [Deltaproteobacteria bacterium]|nr:hypothetical protein [Deltaproteobacteria bacterium]
MRQTATSVPRGDGTCGVLFGDAVQRATNGRQRSASLYWIDTRGARVLVAHGHERWDTPRRLELAGLTLLSVAPERGDATVVVSTELARRAGCTAGRYRVAIDHALGQGTAVLSVLPSGLLVSRGDRVHFLAAAGRRAPEWMMVWGSPFELKPLSEGGSGDAYARYGRHYLRHASID